MKRIASLFLSLSLAGAALADSPKLALPVETKAVGEYVILQPDTTAKAVSYVGQSGVSPFPSQFLADKRVFILPVRGLKPGRYLFTAVGSLNDEHASAPFAVLVGDAPVPPDPTPPDPPADPLVKVLTDAYAQDAGPDKTAHKARLAEMFRQMAGADVRDPRYKTAEQLRVRMGAVAKNLMSDALAKLRLACWQEIVKVLPAENTPLDGKRDEVAGLFLKLSAALGKVP